MSMTVVRFGRRWFLAPRACALPEASGVSGAAESAPDSKASDPGVATAEDPRLTGETGYEVSRAADQAILRRGAMA
jgi:hypothetical protein